ncbi:hypothetical protein INT43_003610 [Umbelopsis isabellina]|uniref:Enoyl reductase (ER) domain-containing protein n=1 Tax=Mortierella isabellina TaxID=91625 RepID=A0A8H7UFK8_MORIS|nr:hypothetical protein INT43_003610 [Umbelopsis isabellina]
MSLFSIQSTKTVAMSQARPTPSKMRAWRLNRLGPFDETLRLVRDFEVPSEPLRAGQILVRITSAGLNPIDYKTPGMDLSGAAVSVGPDVSDIKAGDKVLARIDLTKDTHGALSDKVYNKGGSGGVGSFGIQIAKILSCHVTKSCSTAKSSLCTELGADEVIDYRTTVVVAHLKQGGPSYDVIVDNVGNLTSKLFSACSDILVPEGKFVCVAVTPNLSTLKTIVKGKLLPRFLGSSACRLSCTLLETIMRT